MEWGWWGGDWCIGRGRGRGGVRADYWWETRPAKALRGLTETESVYHAGGLAVSANSRNQSAKITVGVPSSMSFMAAS